MNGEVTSFNDFQAFQRMEGNFYYRPHTKYGEGNVFSLSVHGGGHLPVVQDFATRCQEVRCGGGGGLVQCQVQWQVRWGSPSPRSVGGA